MKRIKRFFAILILLVIVVYILGPKPEKTEFSKDLPSISASIANIEKYVEDNDAGLTLRPDHESRIIWANDSLKERTDYSVLYLHGFSASWYEGYPAHVNFAQKFGANLYIPRLASHGIETEDALIDMTPDALWESTKDALMVARAMGKRVIIMSTSTGGTLALKLAAEFPEYVNGLILYSPNIRINEAGIFMMSKPWGLQIGRKMIGGKHRVTNEDFESKDCQYWYCKYRMEAVVYLQQLVEATMKKTTYNNVTAPVFLGYYYKNEDNQDGTVKVSAMLKMFDQLGTSPDKKVKKAFPEAGDHVIACELTSGSLDEVISETIKFGEEVLKLKAVN
ncbi:MAG: alpha/beta fold hydrolase [Bacteroidota bacterium]